MELLDHVMPLWMATQCIIIMRDHGAVKIYSYNATTDSWSQLPDRVTGRGSITVINGQLTTVGGINSNELLSLTG